MGKLIFVKGVNLIIKFVMNKSFCFYTFYLVRQTALKIIITLLINIRVCYVEISTIGFLTDLYHFSAIVVSFSSQFLTNNGYKFWKYKWKWGR